MLQPLTRKGENLMLNSNVLTVDESIHDIVDATLSVRESDGGCVARRGHHVDYELVGA